MQEESVSKLLGACHEAKRIVELMPKLPQGMKPSHIHVIDVINQLQQRNGSVRVSDIGTALHVTNPGVTRLVNELVELKAVEKAQSTDVDKVIAAMAGQTFKAPSGIVSKMDEKNHHLHKSVFIGEIKADGQFNVVWKTPGPVKAKPWSPYIEGNDKKKDEPEKK